MSIQEAQTAVCNAARALRQSGMVDVRLDALYGALDALDAVGAASSDVAWDQPVPDVRKVRPKHPNCGGCGCDHCQALTFMPSDTPAYWCLDPECWIVLLTPNTYCARHGFQAARGCLPLQPGAPSPEETIRRLRGAMDEPAGQCAVDGCFRQADLPTGTCYHHSPAAALPSLRRRAPELSGVDDG